MVMCAVVCLRALMARPAALLITNPPISCIEVKQILEFFLTFVNVFQEPGMVESLSKNVTRQGMTSTTLNYLRVR
jgi:hypothetical protein